MLSLTQTLKIIISILHISFFVNATSHPISIMSATDIEESVITELAQPIDNTNSSFTRQTFSTITSIIQNFENITTSNEIEQLGNLRGTSENLIPHIFVVNLDRAKSRWEHIQEVMHDADLEIERLPGVDGRQLTETELKTYATKLSLFFQPKGVIGCYLSHRKFWQYVVDRNLPSAIIFEDDVRLIPNFKNKLVSSLQRLDNDQLTYDIIFLGVFVDVSLL